jgi:hypothetical protein
MVRTEVVNGAEQAVEEFRDGNIHADQFFI